MYGTGRQKHCIICPLLSDAVQLIRQRLQHRDHRSMSADCSHHQWEQTGDERGPEQGAGSFLLSSGRKLQQIVVLSREAGHPLVWRRARSVLRLIFFGIKSIGFLWSVFGQNLAVTISIKSNSAKKNQPFYASFNSSLNYSGCFADIDSFIMKMGCVPI